MNSFLSIDLGTTGLKVALLTEAGKIVGSESCEYPILSPRPGYAEQDPESWWTGLVAACRSLKSRYPTEFGQIAGIGICGQMHTQVYLDKDDQVLGPAITWMDQRSSDIVDTINGDADSKELVFEETRNFATTTYTAPQVKWVKDNQPDVWRRTRRILIAKDFIKFRLTGQMVTDYSEASGTLLFDVEKRRWSEAMFSYFGFSGSLFPRVGPSDEIIGQVTPEASELCGIRAGTPVANGSADGAACGLGAGVIDSGQVALAIGTAGGIGVCSDKPLVDPQNRTTCWCYCVRDRWSTVGMIQTAGASLHWFKNAFDKDNTSLSSGDIFEQYNQMVQEIPDGCGGLIFLPYLNGERTPYWDSSARGLFYGINLSSEKAHFIKAVMEGVSFALRHNLETIESLGIEVNQIRAVGGGLKSPVWLGILGRVLRKPIVTMSVPDSANLGNVILCGKALGIYPTLEDAVSRMVTVERQVNYTTDSEVYGRQYPIFLELYQQLKETFRRSASAQG